MASTWWCVPAGAVLGAGFIGWADRKDSIRARRTRAAGLVAASAVYVAFAAIVADWAGVLRAAAGVAIFTTIAGVGVRSGAGWLAAGWALHVLWDGALRVATPEVAPGWYASLCLGFDVVVAGAILASDVGPPRAHRARVPPGASSRMGQDREPTA